MKSILGSLESREMKSLKFDDKFVSERITALREQPLSSHIVNTLAESRLVNSGNESNSENKEKKKDKKDTYIVLYNEFFSGLEVYISPRCYRHINKNTSNNITCMIVDWYFGNDHLGRVDGCVVARM